MGPIYVIKYWILKEIRPEPRNNKSNQPDLKMGPPMGAPWGHRGVRAVGGADGGADKLHINCTDKAS